MKQSKKQSGRWILQISAGSGPESMRRSVRLLADRLMAETTSHEVSRAGDAGDIGERTGDVVDTVVHGDERAPRSIEFTIAGAVGDVLVAQLGNHAVVAGQGRRGRRSRKRWYIGVRVYAANELALGGDAEAIPSADLSITAARSGGPGGQHVNRTATAVRVVHRPTGISVRASNERSQAMNRKIALARLAAVLARRVESTRTAEQKARWLGHRRVRHEAVVRQWRLLGNALEPSSRRSGGHRLLMLQAV